MFGFTCCENDAARVMVPRRRSTQPSSVAYQATYKIPPAKMTMTTVARRFKKPPRLFLRPWSPSSYR